MQSNLTNSDKNSYFSVEDIERRSLVRSNDSVSRYLCLPYPDSPEANGCVVDVFARATIVLSSFFVGPALLKLASQQSIDNCESMDNYEKCMMDPRIYGFKPSSLLTNMGAIASVVSVISLPLVGAAVDFTSYRRQVGMCTAFGLTLIKVLELGFGPNTWFFVACLQVLSSILFQIQKATMYAYSAELSKHPTFQSKFQSSLALTLFASMFIYMFEVELPSRILKFDGDVKTARLAILIAILNCMPLFALSWIYLFRDKPPASNIPMGQTVLTAGFHKLHGSFREISSVYRTVRHFLVFSLAWSEAGITSLPVVSTTYMSEYLEMNSLQIGLVLLIVMIGGMPGSFIGNYFCRLYQNPVKSARLGLVVFTLNTIGAGLFLEPSTKELMYWIGFVWGSCLGWLHPQHTTIFVTLSPKGKGAAEMMGLYLFSCQVLSFIPPLIFTVLNEIGLPMWIGISSLALYTLLGLIGLVCMGDYEAARILAMSDTDLSIATGEIT
eukprot:jgi/Psemu1/326233/estExt_fgenesh1_pg.C_3520006